MFKNFLTTVILCALVGAGIWVYFFRTPTAPPQDSLVQNPGTVTGTVNGKGIDIMRDTKGVTKKLEVTTQSVGYYNSASRGWYVEPTATGTYPGIIVVHEWWGLNDGIKSAAEELAKEGYRVLAVDLYGGRVATTSDDARRYSQNVNTGAPAEKEAIANMKAAAEYLKREGSYSIGILGWCFGGGQALKYALADVNVKATVIYYGSLITDPGRLAPLKSPVLGIFGDKDTSISTTSVKTFDTYLDSKKIANEIYIYPGVGHAFANPSGANYAPAETKDAWIKTTTFLAKYLKGESIVTLEGQYVCLPHKATSGVVTEECMFGLKTKDGSFYALDVNSLSQKPVTNIKVNDGITVTGDLVPIEEISSVQWQKYNIKGIIRVTSYAAL